MGLACWWQAGTSTRAALVLLLAFRIVSYRILQYADGGMELLTRGADDLVHVSAFSSPSTAEGWAEGPCCCQLIGFRVVITTT